MSAETWPAGYGRKVLDTVDSTMAEAARRAPGMAGAEWIMALAQTAARGRRGRLWLMPPGNFAATLVLPVAGGPEAAALRSFVAALALCDALAEASGDPAAFALKWPNDVLCRGGKIAGILLEGLPGDRVAIGFGVNLAAAPSAEEVEPGAVPPVALVAGTGARIGPEPFLDILAKSFAGWEARLATLGFGPIRAAWLARAARLGTQITARMGGAIHHGTFETVDELGHLVLTGPGGRKTLPAAEVFF